MRISLCYIVKDEAAELTRSLASIAGAVDEIVVGLTYPLAAGAVRKACAAFSVRFVEVPWQEDFAAARNAVLSQATGDWIVFLDADEYFLPGAAEALPQYLSNTDKDALLFLLHKVDADKADAELVSFWALRAFRSAAGRGYRGRIHEALWDETGSVRGVMVQGPELQLKHTGYSTAQQRSKAERNLALLLQELKRTEQPELLYTYLAEAYDGLGMATEAMYYACLDVERGRQWVTYASRSYRILLRYLAAGEGTKAERLAVAQQAREEFPELPEFRAELAACLAAAGDYPGAVRAAEEALQLWGHPQALYEPVQFSHEAATQLQAALAEWRRELAAPQVSIMIPTYNRPELFELTLQAALAQTYDSFEVVVCDNSTDERTAEIIAERYAAEPRLRYFRNREAQSKAENFMPFEELARGEYLQWLMDDDIILPDKLTKMMAVFTRFPDITLVTSLRGVINEQGELVERPYQELFNIPGEVSRFEGKALGRDLLVTLKNFIGEPSAVLFRRKDLQHHYWRAESRGCETISDVAMWLELLEQGNAAIFREPLSYYRRHSQQEGQQPEVILLSRLEWYALIEEYYARGVFLTSEQDCQLALGVLYKEYQDGTLAELAEKAPDMWQVYAELMEKIGGRNKV